MSVEPSSATRYLPLNASLHVRKRYGKAVLESWMKPKRTETRVIRLVQTTPIKAGELFGSHVTFWLLACPACSTVAELNHTLMLLDDLVTMSPSLICPTCGWHDIIQGWELRR